MKTDMVNVRLTQAGRDMAAGGTLSIHGHATLNFKGDTEQPVNLAVWHELLKTTVPHGQAIFEIVPAQPAATITAIKPQTK